MERPADGVCPKCGGAGGCEEVTCDVCRGTGERHDAPIRIRLSRAKGWRMPANTVSVARPTTWGNPFVIGETYPIVEEGHHEPIGESKIEDAADAVRAFRSWCEETMVPFGDLDPLRGKNLGCWCALDAPCHADVLLELANA